ncbi:MAG: 6-phosphogluconolactonase [Candidatus Eisenbacteria bacterium]|nr:6-phosphogluconolactonase [Candidatus Eisenbacteria bacterium]
MTPTILVLPTPIELFSTAARRATASLGEAIAARGVAHLVLAGGATPAGLYQRLAMPDSRHRVDWKNVHFWWGDERGVPIEDPASNYRMARDTLLAHLDLEPSRVHRMVADPTGLEASARRYDQQIETNVSKERGSVRFDLVLLGVGADGHTASLFPHRPTLGMTDQRVAAVTGTDDWPRLTLTLPVINAARHVHILASGISKARAVARALTGEPGPDSPASLVRPDPGQLLWMVDEEANRLRDGSRWDDDRSDSG